MAKKNVTQKIIENLAAKKPAIPKKLPKFIPGNAYTFDDIKVFAVAPSRAKGSYIVEDEEGAAYTVLLTELEPYSGENQYKAGYEAGQEWASQVECEIRQDVQYHSDLTSSDYAKGYLEGVRRLFNHFVWDYDSIVKEIEL